MNSIQKRPAKRRWNAKTSLLLMDSIWNPNRKEENRTEKNRTEGNGTEGELRTRFQNLRRFQAKKRKWSELIHSLLILAFRLFWPCSKPLKTFFLGSCALLNDFQGVSGNLFTTRILSPFLRPLHSLNIRPVRRCEPCLYRDSPHQGKLSKKFLFCCCCGNVFCFIFGIYPADLCACSVLPASSLCCLSAA